MFGFGKKNKTAEVIEPETAASTVSETETQKAANEEAQEAATESVAAPEPVAEFDRSTGPWDTEEQDTNKGYVDFGSLKVKIIDGLNMRVDLEQSSQQLVAITLTKGTGVLQVQAFAAPKSKGIWDDIRAEIANSVRQQKGQVDFKDSHLGRELISRIPAKTADGRPGFRVARFVGVDGPRWFLRGVFSGDAALKAETAQEMEDIFRSLVVVRGEEPMAPRDLLPMKMPEQILEAQQKQQEAEATTDDEKKLELPRRGPEIAEIR